MSNTVMLIVVNIDPETGREDLDYRVLGHFLNAWYAEKFAASHAEARYGVLTANGDFSMGKVYETKYRYNVRYAAKN